MSRTTSQTLHDNGLTRWLDQVDQCPWGAVAGRHTTAPDAVDIMPQRSITQARGSHVPLYTYQQRQRRDASRWTLVQGILAPVQFAIFLVSLCLVLRYVFTGSGWMVASLSVVVKTAALYAIMVTGAIWENAVFGQYLFAPAFFWEDVFSMLVLALHTVYVVALFAGLLSGHALMLVALAAYASYAINATQFILKLRMARRDQAGMAA